MNSLVPVEAKSLVSFDENSFQTFYERVRAEHTIENPDISTEEGRQKIRSAAFKVAKIKKDVERQADALKADAQKTIKIINEGKNGALEKMQALQDEIRKPLTQWEQAEEDRVKRLENTVQFIEGLSELPENYSTEEIETRIDVLNKHFSPTEDWQEFKNRAELAKKNTLEKLSAALDKRKKYEADQAELAKLRKEQEEREQKERDERIAKEAAEKARKEAEEKAERERKEREAGEKFDRDWSDAHREYADRERAASEQREREAKDRAAAAEWLAMYNEAVAENNRMDDQARAAREAQERAKKDQEERENRAWLDMYAEADSHNRALDAAAKAKRDEQEAQAKREREAEAERKRREDDLEHRRKINTEAMADLIDVLAPIVAENGPLNAEKILKGIITAIAQGKIKHVSITY